MIEDRVSPMGLDRGFELLERHCYDKAKLYFQERLDADYLAYYGFATALFRKGVDIKIMGISEIDEVIRLYQKSLMLNPQFADSYLMLGMVYEKKSGMVKGRTPKDKVTIKKLIESSKKHLLKAKELNQGFSELVDKEIISLRRMRLRLN